MEFLNKLAFITGASAGLGKEFALQMHALGADIVVCARREDELATLCKQLNDKRDKSARFFVWDLTVSKDLDLAVAFLKSERIDILVNNAGRGSFGRYETLDITKELEMVKLNIEAPMVLTHAVLPQMKERKSGIIVVLSSIAGVQPLPYMATYAATKAFDLSLGLALAREVHKFGIQVLTVCPGPTATEFGKVAEVPGEFRGMGSSGSASVVRESLQALERSHYWIVPCLAAKLFSWPSRLLPARLSTFLTEKALSKALYVKEKGK
jgi:uncharacterized protein